jgi:hypothetical protein
MSPLGPILRELLKFYPTTYEMKVAINDYRRAHGAKNFDSATRALLSQHLSK